ncbi:protein ALTERED PHOSPHATE STARVATION RESPONSE 1-like [Humulus lupulus]|uniref:protein ALTERED PHOSPHATE STARVATION RESPONSE 1-like n=1 Tax=Humulus lupulus TaxID=3486 RepID=UPI002B415FCA|nr:protein ALTERED PHOSPHATE STARVATION RESPONSE 1-like [Humulus lupulus]
MGCVASKLEEEEVVSICRERKQKLKLAVDKRHALAEAHWRYSQALFAVSAAIKLFVARHSSPSSPFLITFPPPCSSSSSPPCENQNVITNPMFLQQMPSESTCETVDCGSCASSTSSSDSEEQEEEDEEEEVREVIREPERREELHQPCGYFYMQMPPPSMPSPQRDFGWDFFNPFDNVNRPEVISGYRHNLDDDVLRVVREEEGIPELEEEENKVVVAEDKDEKRVENGTVNEVAKIDETSVNQVEPKGLTVIDTPVEGRELLEALKDIEDYFIKAYESGKDVSRMLEANMVQMQSGLEEIKENSTKLIQSARHRSIISKPSSCKSLVASSSKSSSSWTEFRNDLFDDYGGMASGSHSLTLGRLYAWEKKLYEEVKAGDSTRKLYEKKCSRLRNLDVRGDDELTMDKTRATVKDLYARILVAIRSAESISIKIEKLRDEELLPQIVELLKGLTRTWKILLESHETQNKILIEVKKFTCPAFGKFSNESHWMATVQLQAELHNWRACFVEYVAAQKAYVEALHGWLTKFIVPEVEFYSRSKGSAVSCRVNGPPLLMICHDWLASIEKLPEKSVAFALRSFTKDVKALLVQQGQEQLQKRKVDSLAKELDRRVLAFQKTEGRFLESKFIEHKESDAENPNEYLNEKKDQLDMLRRRLDVEKEKHHNLMLETQRITLNGFQTGFCTVFESLIEFSKASQNMYNDLVTDSENSEKAGNMSYIEDTRVEQNNSKMTY